MPGLAQSVREGRSHYRFATDRTGRTFPSRVVDYSEGRARAIAWARALTEDPATVFLDTETTGLGGDAEIVEIAVVAADGRVLLDTLVRPLRRIPADASRIHGILDAHVVDAPDWRSLHPALCALLAERPVVVYNAAFDRRIVAQCCGRHRLDDPAASWQCAMLAYAQFRGEATARRGGFRWFKLGDAAAAFGLPAAGHRATADALACRAVVLGMADATP